MLQGNWKLLPKSPWSSACAMSIRRWIRSCEDEPVRGLPDSVDMKISAPAAVLEFDTRDNLFTPTRGMYAESSYLASRENSAPARNSSASSRWSWAGCRWATR